MPKLRGVDTLTGRLKQTADLLLEGLSNQEIANEFGTKTRTVKAYVRRLKLHFDAPNRVHIAIKLLGTTRLEHGPMPRLTPKQLIVANLVADGMNNYEIAAKTGCTYGTTRNIMKDLYDRCGMWSRLELVLFLLHHRGANSDANRN